MAKSRCRAAVFEQVGKPLEMREFDLPGDIEPGAALCKIDMSSICGSDLHTIGGRRVEPAPLILGHESVGTIAAVGGEPLQDWNGKALKKGDRVSWSVMASCGGCFYCERELPQKCESLRKYGHTCCSDPPHLTGGYAEYIYLFAGTAIFKVPDRLTNEIAAPANCALATAVNAVETIGLEEGDSVFVQGAGLLGLNAIGLARSGGAGKIVVTDLSEARLELAGQFGADMCLNPGEHDSDDICSRIRQEVGEHGVDLAIQACGASESVEAAVESLRIGGRYLIAGLVSPGSDLGMDGNQVTRKCLTIKGIHNYRPSHLGKALEFLEEYASKYPYEELVGKVFPLAEINKAVETAASGRYIRVGVC